MIKSVKVTNYLNESLTLELTSPEKSGLVISEITGLGPVEADINMTEFASGDGSYYNSARVGERNIVLNLLYMGKPDIESTRQLTYKYFPVKKNLTLTFTLDNRVAYIQGYVESNDVNMFSEQSGAQISILCPDPYFYSFEKTYTDLSGVEPVFQFPFSKEIHDDTQIEFSQIRILKDRSVVYNGDADVGVTINVHCLGPVEGLTIYNTSTREVMTFNDDVIEKVLGSKLQRGDDLMIVTNKGSKAVLLTREGITYNIVHSVGKDASWFRLSKGDNVFTYTTTVGEFSVQMQIVSNVIYEGI